MRGKTFDTGLKKTLYKRLIARAKTAPPKTLKTQCFCSCFWHFTHSQRASTASVTYVSKITKSQKTEPRLKIHKGQKTFSTPQNFTKSQKSPEHPFPPSNLSVSFTSLWAFSLCVVYLSVSFTSLRLKTCIAIQKPKKQWFFNVFEVSGFSLLHY